MGLGFRVGVSRNGGPSRASMNIRDCMGIDLRNSHVISGFLMGFRVRAAFGLQILF